MSSRWATQCIAFAASAAVLLSLSASAIADDAGVADAASDALHDAAADAGADSADAELDAGRIWTSCTEHVPSEAQRPKLTESFPERGLAGHALALRIRVEHGKGETVFPNGIHVQTGSETARALAEAGFHTPAEDGGSGPQLVTRIEGDRAITEATISFVALPDKPGRHTLLLPPVPVAIARASGELVTLCSEPHQVVIEDPTSNVPDAMPKPNPPPRSQRELWTIARDVTYGVLLGGAVAALVTWLVLRWLRRPRPAPPPPPPRPAWELALEELASIRRAGLVASGKLSEHFDQVSDALRRYLGLRYGFDGIESTTDEVVQTLRGAVPAISILPTIVTLLEESDLVKFARMAPTPEDCDSVLLRAEQIVRDTMPAVPTAHPAPPVHPSEVAP